MQVLLYFFAILCFTFSGVGILVMLAEVIFTGKVFDDHGTMPSKIRTLMYIASAALGAALWGANTYKKDQKKQE